MEWLKLNEEGELEFVMEEAKLVPEVQAMLTLNYNKSPGDIAGRKRYKALTELRYMYLVYSPKSPYRDYLSEKEKIDEAKQDCGFSSTWVESKELKDVIQKYLKGNENKITRSLRLVEKFLDKFETHLLGIDLNERTTNEGLVHAPAAIMKTLQELPRFLSTLQELEQQARLGLVAAPTSKGDHELGWIAITKDSGRRKEKRSDQETLDTDNE